jgi:hypothetical protein
VGAIATEYNQTTVKLELMHWMDSVMYQTDPQRPPKTHLPTMYDLPNEDPGDPGLPDVFHDIQPQLLRETFCPPGYTKDNIERATSGRTGIQTSRTTSRSPAGTQNSPG